jgi:hypothetical protein
VVGAVVQDRNKPAAATAQGKRIFRFMSAKNAFRLERAVEGENDAKSKGKGFRKVIRR